MDVLARLHAAGLTIVMVTHDPRMGERAERTLRMRDGRILGDDTAPGSPPTGTTPRPPILLAGRWEFQGGKVAADGRAEPRPEVNLQTVHGDGPSSPRRR